MEYEERCNSNNNTTKGPLSFEDDADLETLLAIKRDLLERPSQPTKCDDPLEISSSDEEQGKQSPKTSVSIDSEAEYDDSWELLETNYAKYKSGMRQCKKIRKKIKTIRNKKDFTDYTNENENGEKHSFTNDRYARNEFTNERNNYTNERHEFADDGFTNGRYDYANDKRNFTKGWNVFTDKRHNFNNERHETPNKRPTKFNFPNKIPGLSIQGPNYLEEKHPNERLNSSQDRHSSANERHDATDERLNSPQERHSFGATDTRPNFSNKANHRYTPNYTNERRNSSQERHSFANDTNTRPNYTQERRSFANERHEATDTRPNHTQERRSFANDSHDATYTRPNHTQERRSFANERHDATETRPNFPNKRHDATETRPNFPNKRHEFPNKRPSFANKKLNFPNKIQGFTIQNPEEPITTDTRPNSTNDRLNFPEDANDTRPDFYDKRRSFRFDRPDFSDELKSYAGKRFSYLESHDARHNIYKKRLKKEEVKKLSKRSIREKRMQILKGFFDIIKCDSDEEKVRILEMFFDSSFDANSERKKVLEDLFGFTERNRSESDAAMNRSDELFIKDIYQKIKHLSVPKKQHKANDEETFNSNENDFYALPEIENDEFSMSSVTSSSFYNRIIADHFEKKRKREKQEQEDALKASAEKRMKQKSITEEDLKHKSSEDKIEKGVKQSSSEDKIENGVKQSSSEDKIEEGRKHSVEERTQQSSSEDKVEERKKQSSSEEKGVKQSSSEDKIEEGRKHSVEERMQQSSSEDKVEERKQQSSSEDTVEERFKQREESLKQSSSVDNVEERSSEKNIEERIQVETIDKRKIIEDSLEDLMQEVWQGKIKKRVNPDLVTGNNLDELRQEILGKLREIEQNESSSSENKFKTDKEEFNIGEKGLIENEFDNEEKPSNDFESTKKETSTNESEKKGYSFDVFEQNGEKPSLDLKNDKEGISLDLKNDKEGISSNDNKKEKPSTDSSIDSNKQDEPSINFRSTNKGKSSNKIETNENSFDMFEFEDKEEPFNNLKNDKEGKSSNDNKNQDEPSNNFESTSKGKSTNKPSTNSSINNYKQDEPSINFESTNKGKSSNKIETNENSFDMFEFEDEEKPSNNLKNYKEGMYFNDNNKKDEPSNDFESTKKGESSNGIDKHENSFDMFEFEDEQKPSNNLKNDNTKEKPSINFESTKKGDSCNETEKKGHFFDIFALMDKATPSNDLMIDKEGKSSNGNKIEKPSTDSESTKKGSSSNKTEMNEYSFDMFEFEDEEKPSNNLKKYKEGKFSKDSNQKNEVEDNNLKNDNEGKSSDETNQKGNSSVIFTHDKKENPCNMQESSKNSGSAVNDKTYSHVEELVCRYLKENKRKSSSESNIPAKLQKLDEPSIDDLLSTLIGDEERPKEDSSSITKLLSLEEPESIATAEETSVKLNPEEAIANEDKKETQEEIFLRRKKAVQMLLCTTRKEESLKNPSGKKENQLKENEELKTTIASNKHQSVEPLKATEATKALPIVTGKKGNQHYETPGIEIEEKLITTIPSNKCQSVEATNKLPIITEKQEKQLNENDKKLITTIASNKCQSVEATNKLPIITGKQEKQLNEKPEKENDEKLITIASNKFQNVETSIVTEATNKLPILTGKKDKQLNKPSGKENEENLIPTKTPEPASNKPRCEDVERSIIPGNEATQKPVGQLKKVEKHSSKNVATVKKSSMKNAPDLTNIQNEEGSLIPIKKISKEQKPVKTENTIAKAPEEVIDSTGNQYEEGSIIATEKLSEIKGKEELKKEVQKSMKKSTEGTENINTSAPKEEIDSTKKLSEAKGKQELRNDEQKSVEEQTQNLVITGMKDEQKSADKKQLEEQTQNLVITGKKDEQKSVDKKQLEEQTQNLVITGKKDEQKSVDKKQLEEETQNLVITGKKDEQKSVEKKQLEEQTQYLVITGKKDEQKSVDKKQHEEQTQNLVITGKKDEQKSVDKKQLEEQTQNLVITGKKDEQKSVDKKQLEEQTQNLVTSGKKHKEATRKNKDTKLFATEDFDSSKKECEEGSMAEGKELLKNEEENSVATEQSTVVCKEAINTLVDTSGKKEEQESVVKKQLQELKNNPIITAKTDKKNDKHIGKKDTKQCKDTTRKNNVAQKEVIDSIKNKSEPKNSLTLNKKKHKKTKRENKEKKLSVTKVQKEEIDPTKNMQIEKLPIEELKNEEQKSVDKKRSSIAGEEATRKLLDTTGKETLKILVQIPFQHQTNITWKSKEGDLMVTKIQQKEIASTSKNKSNVVEKNKEEQLMAQQEEIALTKNKSKLAEKKETTGKNKEQLNAQQEEIASTKNKSKFAEKKETIGKNKEQLIAQQEEIASTKNKSKLAEKKEIIGKNKEQLMAQQEEIASTKNKFKVAEKKETIGKNKEQLMSQQEEIASTKNKLKLAEKKETTGKNKEQLIAQQEEIASTKNKSKVAEKKETTGKNKEQLMAQQEEIASTNSKLNFAEKTLLDTAGKEESKKEQTYSLKNKEHLVVAKVQQEEIASTVNKSNLAEIKLLDTARKEELKKERTHSSKNNPIGTGKKASRKRSVSTEKHNEEKLIKPKQKENASTDKSVLHREKHSSVAKEERMNHPNLTKTEENAIPTKAQDTASSNENKCALPVEKIVVGKEAAKRLLEIIKKEQLNNEETNATIASTANNSELQDEKNNSIVIAKDVAKKLLEMIRKEEAKAQDASIGLQDEKQLLVAGKEAENTLVDIFREKEIALAKNQGEETATIVQPQLKLLDVSRIDELKNKDKEEVASVKNDSEAKSSVVGKEATSKLLDASTDKKQHQEQSLTKELKNEQKSDMKQHREQSPTTEFMNKEQKSDMKQHREQSQTKEFLNKQQKSDMKQHREQSPTKEFMNEEQISNKKQHQEPTHSSKNNPNLNGKTASNQHREATDEKNEDALVTPKAQEVDSKNKTKVRTEIETTVKTELLVPEGTQSISVVAEEEAMETIDLTLEEDDSPVQTPRKDNVELIKLQLGAENSSGCKIRDNSDAELKKFELNHDKGHKEGAIDLTLEEDDSPVQTPRKDNVELIKLQLGAENSSGCKIGDNSDAELKKFELNHDKGHKEGASSLNEDTTNRIQAYIGHSEDTSGHNEDSTGHHKECASRLNEDPTGLNQYPSGHMEDPTGHMQDPSGHNEDTSGHKECGLDDSTGQNQNPSRSNQNPSGHNENPSRPIQNPFSNNQNPSGHNQRPSGQNQIPSGSNQNPSGHNQNPSRPIQNPSGHNQNPSGHNQNPSGHNQNPSGHNQNPSGPNQNPFRPIQHSSGQNQNPSGHNQNPSGHNQNPSGHNQNPSGHNQNPSGHNQNPSRPIQNSSDQNPSGSNQNHSGHNQNPSGPNQNTSVHNEDSTAAQKGGSSKSADLNGKPDYIDHDDELLKLVPNDGEDLNNVEEDLIRLLGCLAEEDKVQNSQDQHKSNGLESVNNCKDKTTHSEGAVESSEAIDSTKQNLDSSKFKLNGHPSGGLEEEKDSDKQMSAVSTLIQASTNNIILEEDGSGSKDLQTNNPTVSQEVEGIASNNAIETFASTPSTLPGNIKEESASPLQATVESECVTISGNIKKELTYPQEHPEINPRSRPTSDDVIVIEDDLPPPPQESTSIKSEFINTSFEHPPNAQCDTNQHSNETPQCDSNQYPTAEFEVQPDSVKSEFITTNFLSGSIADELIPVVKSEYVSEETRIAQLVEKLLAKDNIISLLDHRDFFKIVHPLIQFISTTLSTIALSRLNSIYQDLQTTDNALLKENVKKALDKLDTILGKVDVLNFKFEKISQLVRDFSKRDYNAFLFDIMVLSGIMHEPRTSFGKLFYKCLGDICKSVAMSSSKLCKEASDLVSGYDKEKGRAFVKTLSDLFPKCESVEISDDEEEEVVVKETRGYIKSVPIETLLDPARRNSCESNGSSMQEGNEAIEQSSVGLQRQLSNPNDFQPQLSSPNDFQRQLSNPNDFQRQLSNPNDFQRQLSNPNDFQRQLSNPNDFQPQLSNQSQLVNPNNFQSPNNVQPQSSNPEGYTYNPLQHMHGMMPPVQISKGEELVNQNQQRPFPPGFNQNQPRVLTPPHQNNHYPNQNHLRRHLMNNQSDRPNPQNVHYPPPSEQHKNLMMQENRPYPNANEAQRSRLTLYPSATPPEMLEAQRNKASNTSSPEMFQAQRSHYPPMVSNVHDNSAQIRQMRKEAEEEKYKRAQHEFQMRRQQPYAAARMNVPPPTQNNIPRLVQLQHHEHQITRFPNVFQQSQSGCRVMLPNQTYAYGSPNHQTNIRQQHQPRYRTRLDQFSNQPGPHVDQSSLKHNYRPQQKHVNVDPTMHKNLIEQQKQYQLRHSPNASAMNYAQNQMTNQNAKVQPNREIARQNFNESQSQRRNVCPNEYPFLYQRMSQVAPLKQQTNIPQVQQPNILQNQQLNIPQNQQPSIPAIQQQNIPQIQPNIPQNQQPNAPQIEQLLQNQHPNILQNKQSIISQNQQTNILQNQQPNIPQIQNQQAVLPIARNGTKASTTNPPPYHHPITPENLQLNIPQNQPPTLPIAGNGTMTNPPPYPLGNPSGSQAPQLQFPRNAQQTHPQNNKKKHQFIGDLLNPSTSKNPNEEITNITFTPTEMKKLETVATMLFGKPVAQNNNSKENTNGKSHDELWSDINETIFKTKENQNSQVTVSADNPFATNEQRLRASNEPNPTAVGNVVAKHPNSNGQPVEVRSSSISGPKSNQPVDGGNIAARSPNLIGPMNNQHIAARHPNFNGPMINQPVGQAHNDQNFPVRPSNVIGQPVDGHTVARHPTLKGPVNSNIEAISPNLNGPRHQPIDDGNNAARSPNLNGHVDGNITARHPNLNGPKINYLVGQAHNDRNFPMKPSNVIGQPIDGASHPIFKGQPVDGNIEARSPNLNGPLSKQPVGRSMTARHPNLNGPKIDQHVEQGHSDRNFSMKPSNVNGQPIDGASHPNFNGQPVDGNIEARSPNLNGPMSNQPVGRSMAARHPNLNGPKINHPVGQAYNDRNFPMKPSNVIGQPIDGASHSNFKGQPVDSNIETRSPNLNGPMSNQPVGRSMAARHPNLNGSMNNQPVDGNIASRHPNLNGPNIDQHVGQAHNDRNFPVRPSNVIDGYNVARHPHLKGPVNNQPVDGNIEARSPNLNGPKHNQLLDDGNITVRSPNLNGPMNNQPIDINIAARHSNLNDPKINQPVGQAHNDRNFPVRPLNVDEHAVGRHPNLKSQPEARSTNSNGSKTNQPVVGNAKARFPNLYGLMNNQSIDGSIAARSPNDIGPKSNEPVDSNIEARSPNLNGPTARLGRPNSNQPVGENFAVAGSPNNQPVGYANNILTQQNHSSLRDVRKTGSKPAETKNPQPTSDASIRTINFNQIDPNSIQSLNQENSVQELAKISRQVSDLNRLTTPPQTNASPVLQLVFDGQQVVPASTSPIVNYESQQLPAIGSTDETPTIQIQPMNVQTSANNESQSVATIVAFSSSNQTQIQPINTQAPTVTNSPPLLNNQNNNMLATSTPVRYVFDGQQVVATSPIVNYESPLQNNQIKVINVEDPTVTISIGNSEYQHIMNLLSKPNVDIGSSQTSQVMGTNPLGNYSPPLLQPINSEISQASNSQHLIHMSGGTVSENQNSAADVISVRASTESKKHVNRRSGSGEQWLNTILDSDAPTNRADIGHHSIEKLFSGISTSGNEISVISGRRTSYSKENLAEKPSNSSENCVINPRTSNSYERSIEKGHSISIEKISPRASHGGEKSLNRPSNPTEKAPNSNDKCLYSQRASNSSERSSASNSIEKCLTSRRASNCSEKSNEKASNSIEKCLASRRASNCSEKSNENASNFNEKCLTSRRASNSSEKSNEKASNSIEKCLTSRRVSNCNHKSNDNASNSNDKYLTSRRASVNSEKPNTTDRFIEKAPNSTTSRRALNSSEKTLDRASNPTGKAFNSDAKHAISGRSSNGSKKSITRASNSIENAPKSNEKYVTNRRASNGSEKTLNPTEKPSKLNEKSVRRATEKTNSIYTSKDLNYTGSEKPLNEKSVISGRTSNSAEKPSNSSENCVINLRTSNSSERSHEKTSNSTGKHSNSTGKYSNYTVEKTAKSNYKSSTESIDLTTENSTDSEEDPINRTLNNLNRISKIIVNKKRSVSGKDSVDRASTSAEKPLKVKRKRSTENNENLVVASKKQLLTHNENLMAKQLLSHKNAENNETNEKHKKTENKKHLRSHKKTKSVEKLLSMPTLHEPIQPAEVPHAISTSFQANNLSDNVLELHIPDTEERVSEMLRNFEGDANIIDLIERSPQNEQQDDESSNQVQPDLDSSGADNLEIDEGKEYPPLKDQPLQNQPLQNQHLQDLPLQNQHLQDLPLQLERTMSTDSGCLLSPIFEDDSNRPEPLEGNFRNLDSEVIDADSINSVESVKWCCVCGKEADMACECTGAIYCSVECQVANWNEHRTNCTWTGET